MQNNEMQCNAVMIFTHIHTRARITMQQYPHLKAHIALQHFNSNNTITQNTSEIIQEHKNHAYCRSYNIKHYSHW